MTHFLAVFVWDMLYAHILQWPKRIKGLSQYSWHKYNVIKPLPLLIFYAWKKITVGYLWQITAETITWQWISMDTINEHLVVYPMDVSVLFYIVIFLTFNSKSMLSKAITNPGWEAIWCCFNKSWASSDAWASRQSSKQLPEQAWTWPVTLSVSSFSLTCSWDILSLAVISTSLWWAPRISSLLKVDVFEHVSLSLHSLLRFAFKERIF